MVGWLVGWFLWLPVYVTNGFWPRVCGWQANGSFKQLPLLLLPSDGIPFFFHFVAVGGLFTKKTIC